MPSERDRVTDSAGISRSSGGQITVGIPEHVRSTHGQDGATILDILNGQMFRLNLAASRILELLKKGWESSAIAEQLAREFAIEHLRAEADVCEFIETLAKHRLVTPQKRTSRG